MKDRFLLNFTIALQAIRGNKLRSMLTALGIIFGVAAVIAMMAIGKGAEQDILEQIKLVGVNNIVIAPLTKQEENKTDTKEKENESKKFSPGLTIKDAESIQAVLPCAEKISPEVVIETDFVYGGLRRSGKLIGTVPEYFDITGFSLSEGRLFNSNQTSSGEQVCIIGKSIMTKFFAKTDPLGQYIKCGKVWLQIIGVLDERMISSNSIRNLGIRDYNFDIYIPLHTMLLRYTNRTLVTKASLERAQSDNMEEEAPKTQNNNQLDRMVVRISDADLMQSSAEVISRLINRRHNGVTDYEISLPEAMLRQQQRTKKIFNLVLSFIASISLLIGGIGIMNIMLASVLERIKEIGIRLSLGATKKDIASQFLFEAMLISVAGGLIGIGLGIVLSYLIPVFADISTLISGWSVILSFGVAALTGLLFGIAPARRAAEKDPIDSLRYE
ncbi:MAG TPA: ABC transporter permease [Bacteroidia bacterium]|nr:ABC transporter permease [Bacteroidia bacterium]